MSKLKPLLAAAACAVLTLAHGVSQAQQGVTRIVVPFTAGGPADAYARIVAGELSKTAVGQVIIDNKAGASDIPAADFVAKAAPDGHTLLFASNSTLANNPVLFAKLPYDAAKDFAGVAFVGYLPQVLFVRGDTPFKTVGELVAYAKANPGKLNRGSAGIGSITNMAGEMFGSAAGIQVTHVPFSGDGPAIQSMLGGNTDLHVTAVTVALPHLPSGKIRVLGVMDSKRLPNLPDVPTMKEAGYDLDVSSWFVLVAPAQTPREAIDRLNLAVGEVLRRPEVVQKLRAIGMETRITSATELDTFVKAEQARWAPIIRGLGLKGE